MQLKKLLLLTTTLFAVVATDAQLGNVFKKKNKDVPKDTAATNGTETKKEEETEKKKSGGGGFFQKLLIKASKGASKIGGAATGAIKSTDNLDNIEIAGGLLSNLLPKSMGLASMDFISGWKDGYDLVTFFLLPKDKLFFYKLNGSIKIDGTSAKHEVIGLYSAVLPPTQKDRKLEIEAKSGQKATYTLKKPQSPIKLLSINGKNSNCAIDANKDFTIELDNLPTGTDAMVEISLTYSVIGVATTVSIGQFKPAKSITIPGYTIRHIAGDKNVNFKNPYLIVTAGYTDKVMDETGTFKEPLEYGMGSSAALEVSLSGNTEIFKGLEVKGEEKLSGGKMSYVFQKDNAFTSRPFESITKIAATSFAIQGKTGAYEQKENRFTQMKTTTTISFPITDAQLDPILEDLYPKLIKILNNQFNATTLPVETVTASKEFIEMGRYTKSDVNEGDVFSRCYKGLEPKSALVPLAGSFKGENTLFKPLGVDAILKVNIYLQLDLNSGRLIPRTTIELLGRQNGSNLFPATQFFVAEIIGKSYSIPKKGKITDQLVKDIVGADDMLVLFKKGLEEIVEAEKQQGEYKPIWAIKQ